MRGECEVNVRFYLEGGKLYWSYKKRYQIGCGYYGTRVQGKMGTIKHRNGMDLTETEDIKKR